MKLTRTSPRKETLAACHGKLYANGMNTITYRMPSEITLGHEYFITASREELLEALRIMDKMKEQLNKGQDYGN